MPGVALRYFIPRIKHGPLTFGAQRKIIALPEVRIKTILAKVHRPLFCAEHIVYLSVGNCMGKASRHVMIFTFDRRRMLMSFYAAVSLTLAATVIYSKRIHKRRYRIIIYKNLEISRSQFYIISNIYSRILICTLAVRLIRASFLIHQLLNRIVCKYNFVP